MFRQLRNYLIVEIVLANAQRSGIIEGMLIKEVLNARNNTNTDNLHYIYVENHKTGSIQPAIIYLENEIYNYLVTFITRVIPLLPSIKQSRTRNHCHVFQTWTSDRLRTSTISSCMRAGLKLFGIEDPKGCPTNFRKAASTLISMHKPTMQEPLSQFMCHARSTTERHYRHHMSHRGLSSVFTELARCQALPSDEGRSTDVPENYDNGNSQTDHFSANNTVQNLPPCSSVSLLNDGMMHSDDDDDLDRMVHLDDDDDLDRTIASIFEDSININNDSDEYCLGERSTLNSNSSFLSKVSNNIPSKPTTTSVDSVAFQPTIKSRYACKRNGKSIFANQSQEDTFFITFDSLITKALHCQPVSACEVRILACKTDQFRPLWNNLVSEFGDELGLKKVTDKIRTFARNNRKSYKL